MKSSDVIRDVLKRTNVKQVAHGMGLKPPTVYRWVQPADGDGGGAPNPLDRIDRLLDCTNNDEAILQWICCHAGGFFVKNVEVKSMTSEKLIQKASKTMRVFSELLATTNRVIEDGKVTKEESEQLRKEWERVKTIMESFVDCCEQGEFNQTRA